MTEHLFQYMTLSQAIHGFQLAGLARQLSPHTLADYNTTLRKFTLFLQEDLPLVEISRDQIKTFLAAQTTVSQKTLLNYHTGLSALFTWAVKEGLIFKNPMHTIDRPRPAKKPIQPYTEDEIRAMLAALGQSKAYDRPGKRTTSNTIKNADRNRAILLLLIDTGIREQELCSLRLRDLDERNSRITVTGKGRKTRHIPFSSRTGQALWRWQVIRKSLNSPHDIYFLNDTGEPLTTNAVLLLIRRIAARANVSKANVHRFRHTFAINYLKNGGDPWTLQMLLGHSTMEMVRRYLQLAQVDLDNAHKRASPVTNWRL